MIIKLIELAEDNHYGSADGNKIYILREIFINPRQVVCLREDFSTQKKLKDGLLPDGLDPRTKFTKLSLERGHSGIDLVILGDPVAVQAKLEKQILKG